MTYLAYFPPKMYYLVDYIYMLEHVYMRPEVNLNRFEISDCFEMSFRLHGNLHRDFTAAT